MANAKTREQINKEIVDSAIEIITNYPEKETELYKLKKQIQPFSTPSELKETLDNMIVQDPDYIRHYLDAWSNICFQKDFIIDNKENFLYIDGTTSTDIIKNKATYSNNSYELLYSKAKILLVVKDYRLSSHNYKYLLDVYLNGRRLKDTDYILDPGAENYDWTSSSRRIFINQELVSNGDFISIVARKIRNIKKFYTRFTINDISIKNYKFDIDALGPIFDNTDNLVVFKKGFTEDNYHLIDRSEYTFIINNKEIFFILKNTPNDKDKYLIINNKQELQQIRINKDENLDINDYLNDDPVMSLPLTYAPIKVDGLELPMPIRKSSEVECYIKGLRAIPDIDFTVESDSIKGHYIQFKGILYPGSEIIIRSRTRSDYVNDFTNVNIDSSGFINLSDFQIPLGMFYIESFCGRRRIPRFNKTILGDNLIKLHNQHKLSELEIFSEVDWDNVALSMVDKYRSEENQTILTKLSRDYPDHIIDAYSEDKTEEEINDNDDTCRNIYTQREIFLGVFDMIEIVTDKYTILEGHQLHYKVYGKFRDNEEDTEHNATRIDITELCEISGFNPYELGIQTITATYSFYNLNLEATAEVEVVNKKLTDLSVELPSSYFVVGDKIRENVKVLARFEDMSERYLDENNDNYTIDCPEKALVEGSFTITVRFEYDQEMYSAQKVCVVSNTYYRDITDYEIIFSKYIRENNEVITMQLVASYSNGYKQIIDKSLYRVYYALSGTNALVDPDNVQLSLDRSYNVTIDQYSKPGYLNEYKLDVRDEVKHKSIMILNGLIENENRIVVFDTGILYLHQNYNLQSNYKYYRVKDINTDHYITIGKNPTTNNSIYFDTLVNDKLVIVEFLNDLLEVVAQQVFKTKNADDLYELATGKLSGNAIEGYSFAIGKITLGNVTIDQLSTRTSGFYDPIESKYIAKIDTNLTDTITEDTERFYFNFNNFATDTGSVLKIRNMIENYNTGSLEFKISGIDTIIKFTVNTLQYNVSDVETMYFDDKLENTSDYLVIKPLLYKPVTVIDAYHANPKVNSITRFSYVPTGLKFSINSVTKEILIKDPQIGKHIFYLVTKPSDDSAIQKIYYIEITINSDAADTLVRVTDINGNTITKAKYLAIPSIQS